MSPGTAVTFAPVSLRISSAVLSRSAAVRAVITTSTPSRASDMAQARPSPLLAAQTMAFLPLSPRSMVRLLRLVIADTLSLRRSEAIPIVLGIASLRSYDAVNFTRSRISRNTARAASGTGAGRCVARSTNTCTK